MKVDLVSRQELGDFIMNYKSAKQVAELYKALLLGNPKEMKISDDLLGTKCAPMLYSGSCEALIPD